MIDGEPRSLPRSRGGRVVPHLHEAPVAKGRRSLDGCLESPGFRCAAFGLPDDAWSGHVGV